jgi:dienelactone hydrolase
MTDSAKTTPARIDATPLARPQRRRGLPRELVASLAPKVQVLDRAQAAGRTWSEAAPGAQSRKSPAPSFEAAGDADQRVKARPNLSVEVLPVVIQGCPGWLHRPRIGRARSGVVLCAPLGRDARCAHLPMRLLADRLAAAGFAALRYDHADTGEAFDLPDDGDALPVWIEGVKAAAAWLRTSEDLEAVVLGGVRLGASFAAACGDAADGLMLFAPVLSGRGWIRKLQFSAEAGADGSRPDDVGLDTDGLVLSCATIKSLSALDLKDLPATPPKVFLASKGKAAEGLAGRLASVSALTQSPFDELDALFLDASVNEPPMSLFAAAEEWMARSFPGPAAALPESVKASPSGARPAPKLLFDHGHEEIVSFGPTLRGVICRPAVTARAGPAVIFLNTGGDPRAGIGRFAVQAGRRLAMAGVASLRFDFAGVGDSPMPDAAPRSHVFETDRRGDIAAALDLMQAQGFDRFYIVGVCAGAYHAVQVGLNEARVEGVFAISPIKLIWRPEDTVDPAVQDEGRATSAYLQRLVQGRTWERLLRGDIDLATIARYLSLRVKRRLAVMAQRREAAALRQSFTSFAGRGGRSLLLMGLGDASLDEVQTYLGPKGAALNALPGFDVVVDETIDHGLARGSSRARAIAVLESWLSSAAR